MLKDGRGRGKGAVDVVSGSVRIRRQDHLCTRRMTTISCCSIVGKSSVVDTAGSRLSYAAHLCKLVSSIPFFRLFL